METRTFSITLNQSAFDRLKYVADKIPCDPAAMFLYCGLQTLRDILDHKRHISWYRKRLLELERELNDEMV